MPSASTVDLSRLPPPAIVEQLSFDEIVAAMTVDLQTRFPEFDALVESDPALKVLEVAAYREILLRQAFQDAALQLLVAYATGPNLDQLAALVDVARLTVTAADTDSGAAAIVETDDALRQRIVLAPEAFTCAGPELMYVALAKGASGDVLDASAISSTPGAVLVSVLSASGNGAASAELIAAVQAAVSDPAVRPLGDLVTAASAQVVTFDVTAGLTTFSGPDETLVLAAARAGLDAYLADNHKLGRNITLSGLYAALTVVGVEKVTLTSPIADVSCDPTQAPAVATITITHAGDV